MLCKLWKETKRKRKAKNLPSIMAFTFSSFFRDTFGVAGFISSRIPSFKGFTVKRAVQRKRRIQQGTKLTRITLPRNGIRFQLTGHQSPHAVIFGINMKKFAWRKYRKIFLEALISHWRKLFSMILHKINIVALENFLLSLTQS